MHLLGVPALAGPHKQRAVERQLFIDGCMLQARVTAAYFNAETLELAAGARALAAPADTLRCLWVAEPMDKDKVHDVFEQLPDAALTLGYGLLEATPLVAAAVLRAGDGELVGDPIGRPLMNMRARTPLPLLAHRGTVYWAFGYCLA